MRQPGGPEAASAKPIMVAAEVLARFGPGPIRAFQDSCQKRDISRNSKRDEY